MAFAVPTLSALRARARGYFAARLPGADTTLARSSITVSADTMAALTWEQWGYLSQLPDRVMLLDTMEGPYLERTARTYGILRKGAAAAAGSAVFAGANGVAIPAGALLTASDGVTQFATQGAVTISGGAATAGIIATTGGASGNLASGAPLTLVVGIPGVSGTANVGSAGTTGGADQESDDLLRGRALYRRRNPPQGGAATDYVAWAKEVSGVTRAWCYPLNQGPGTVDLAFVLDGRSSIIPLPADVSAVQAHLTAPGKAPVTAVATAFAPVADPTNVTVAGLTPNNANTQAAVQAALADLFATLATPGGTNIIGDGINMPNPAGVIRLEQITVAINGAAGVQGFDLTAPSADIASAPGHIAVLGTVTFA